jgi:hypothetical protein
MRTTDPASESLSEQEQEYRIELLANPRELAPDVVAELNEAFSVVTWRAVRANHDPERVRDEAYNQAGLAG